MVYTGVGVIDARLWRWPFLWEWVGDVPQWRSVSQWHKNYVFVSSQWLLVCRMSLNRRRLQCHSAPFSIIQHFPGHSAERRAPAASTSMCGGAFLSTKTSKTATALVADHASASPGIITATSWDHSDIYSDYIICFFWVPMGLLWFVHRSMRTLGNIFASRFPNVLDCSSCQLHCAEYIQLWIRFKGHGHQLLGNPQPSLGAAWIWQRRRGSVPLHGPAQPTAAFLKRS